MDDRRNYDYFTEIFGDSGRSVHAAFMRRDYVAG